MVELTDLLGLGFLDQVAGNSTAPGATPNSTLDTGSPPSNAVFAPVLCKAAFETPNPPARCSALVPLQCFFVHVAGHNTNATRGIAGVKQGNHASRTIWRNV